MVAIRECSAMTAVMWSRSECLEHIAITSKCIICILGYFSNQHIQEVENGMICGAGSQPGTSLRCIECVYTLDQDEDYSTVAAPPPPCHALLCPR